MPKGQTTAAAAVFCLIIILTVSADAPGVIVRQTNLAEMTADAGTILWGRCVTAEIRTDADLGRDVYDFTFAVNRMLKGGQHALFTASISKTLVDLGQVPAYGAGEEVVLFLHGESDRGFTSPVGLGQGTFRVRIGPGGERTLVNERNNRQLFAGMDLHAFSGRFQEDGLRTRVAQVLTRQAGPIPLDVFLLMTETLLR